MEKERTLFLHIPLFDLSSHFLSLLEFLPGYILRNDVT